MENSQENSFERYLTAKKSVDDRAFNHRVWGELIERLGQNEKAELSVLEVGGGLGTMAERLLGQLDMRNVSYLMVEQDAHLIGAAKANLKSWATEGGYSHKELSANSFQIISKNIRWTISFASNDIFDWFIENEDAGKFDLLIGHAILDLLDIRSFLKAAKPFLFKEALLYFPINYDGLTAFEPAINSVFENLVLAYYNNSMDERIIKGKQSGNSHSGRLLFQQFRDAGIEILVAGSSDWLVYPSQGKYPEDEADFLLHILDTIERELLGHPKLDREEFKKWIMKRKEQLIAGELIFMAHQIDALGMRK